MKEARRPVTIVNQRGLHARASAKFVGLVAELPETTRVRVVHGSNEAAGGSILGLMMLGAARGNEIEIVVTGENCDAVADDLCELVGNGFGED